VFRAGKERQIEIKSGTRPPEQQLAQNGGQGGDDEDQGGGDNDHPAVAGPAVLGMQVTPLTPASRGQYNIPDSVRAGVVVQSVKGSSDAGDKGLQRGDVIVQAGDKEVASAADLSAAVAEWKKAGRTSIPLGVR